MIRLGIIDPTVVRLPGLQRQRLEAALTQEQLAEKAGVGRLTITRLEGGGEARPTTLRKLADALSVTPADLMREPTP